MYFETEYFSQWEHYHNRERIYSCRIQYFNTCSTQMYGTGEFFVEKEVGPMVKFVLFDSLYHIHFSGTSYSMLGSL